MCFGNRLVWHCKRCFGVVLVDTRYRVRCLAALTLSGRCPYEATMWVDRHLQAGGDVNPRESLTDPTLGAALLRWNEFYCVYCEVVIQVLHPLDLHAESPALDAENGNEREKSDSQPPAWPLALARWRTVDLKDSARRGDSRFNFLIPVDHCGKGNDNDDEDEDKEEGGAPLHGPHK